MSKALIIGAAGFVGGYLIDCLNNEFRMEVFGTKLKDQNYSRSNTTILDLNILNKDEIVDLLNKVHPDYIFHLAAQSSVALSWRDPQLTVDINIKGAINLYEALREIDYKPRVLVVGSGEEYGKIKNPELQVTEDTNLYPGNIYAATKVCQNMIGSIYANAYNLDIIFVRAFNHIGPEQSPIFVVSDFCKQVAEIEKGIKEPILYVGNLSAKRDFTDVRDVVRAYALLVQKGISGETYNVASGNAVQINDILQMILSFTDVKISVKTDSLKLRPIDIPKIEADISKIISTTGWTRKTDLKQTLKETLDYWRAHI